MWPATSDKLFRMRRLSLGVFVALAACGQEQSHEPAHDNHNHACQHMPVHAASRLMSERSSELETRARTHDALCAA